MFRAADAFAAGAPQHDDMTLVVLRISVSDLIPLIIVIVFPERCWMGQNKSAKVRAVTDRLRCNRLFESQFGGALIVVPPPVQPWAGGDEDFEKDPTQTSKSDATASRGYSALRTNLNCSIGFPLANLYRRYRFQSFRTQQAYISAPRNGGFFLVTCLGTFDTACRI